MSSVWGELKRRNVVRVAIAYAIVAWLLIEIVSTTFPILKLPEWTVTFMTVVLVIGFPVALIFAWAFELTPEGLKKEKDVDRSESITHATARKLDFTIIGVLVIAVGFLLVDKFYFSEGSKVADEVIATERVSIAVLPFVNMSDDPNNEYFSEGISEEILNLLANVPELQVTSRSSAFSFKGQNVDIPTMAATLKVAHVLEGSVRKSGDQLRITAQLIRVANDSHLWSETYDRELRNVFAIQDEIAAAVVDALQITLLGKEPKATETNPEAYALYLQAQHFVRQVSAEGSRQAEKLLMQALAIDPDFAPAWSLLGRVYFSQGALLALRSIDEGSELARHAVQRIDGRTERRVARSQRNRLGLGCRRGRRRWRWRLRCRRLRRRRGLLRGRFVAPAAGRREQRQRENQPDHCANHSVSPRECCRPESNASLEIAQGAQCSAIFVTQLRVFRVLACQRARKLVDAALMGRQHIRMACRGVTRLAGIALEIE